MIHRLMIVTALMVSGATAYAEDRPVNPIDKPVQSIIPFDPQRQCVFANKAYGHGAVIKVDGIAQKCIYSKAERVNMLPGAVWAEWDEDRREFLLN